MKLIDTYNKTKLNIQKYLKKKFGAFNYFLEEFISFLRRFLIHKIILLVLYISLLLVSIYAGYHIFFDLYSHFTVETKTKEFPFILQFSEDLFLYFLPIFTITGFLSYYQDKMQSILMEDVNTPKDHAEKSLHLTKELFFSSVLAYSVIKTIDIIFFRFDPSNINQIFAVGIFVTLLGIFVIIQHMITMKSSKNK